MEKRSLDIKQFIIYPKFCKNDPSVLSDVNGNDLFELLKNKLTDFIDKTGEFYLKGHTVDDENENNYKRTINIDTFKSEENEIKSHIYFSDSTRCISGKISTGYYGQAGNIIDKDKVPVFSYSRNHAIPKPFFFLICIPEGRTTGYFMTEKNGIYGISQVMNILLHHFVKLHLEEYTFSSCNFYQDVLIDRYLKKGIIQQLKISTSDLPKDIADRYGLTNYEGNKYKLELKITALDKKKGLMGNIVEKIRSINKNNSNKVVNFNEEFKEIGFDETSNITLDSTIDDNKQIIQLTNMSTFKSLYKINVEIDSDGHSNFYSIESEAIKLLKSLNLNLFNNV